MIQEFYYGSFYLSRARRNKINSNKGETEENNEVQ